MQATLIYLAAPAEMRSRMYGVLSVCIGSGPIGFLALGVLADLIGASTATALSGGGGVVRAGGDMEVVAPARDRLFIINAALSAGKSCRSRNLARAGMLAAGDREDGAGADG